MVEKITQTQRLEKIYLNIENVKSLPEEQSVANKLDLMEMLVFFRSADKENIILLSTVQDEEEITREEMLEIEKTMPLIKFTIQQLELKLEVYYLD